MTVVRITIKKNLTPSAYSYHQAASGHFASEYLVRTDAPFPSPQLREYARAIALAESRLYPPCVQFEGAIVKLATPGASAPELRGQFSQVGLDKLVGPDTLRGQLERGEDEVLAFPPVTAVYVRQARWGRNGRLLMPHALSTTEWNLYTQKQVLPLRFQRPSDSAPTRFSDELMEAIRPANGSYVMPGPQGETEQSLRKITVFFFADFDVSSLKMRRKKSSLAAKRAARPAPSKVPVPGVVYLLRAQIQGQAYYKIGKSIIPGKRVGQIKLQLPFPVEVVHTIQATYPSQVETYWHRPFAALRRNGEWFELTEAEVEEFKRVSEM